MENQKPSIGRIVHYMSRGSKDGVFEPELRAAIITEVKIMSNADQSVQETIVSLCVLNPTGLHFVQGVQEGNDPGQWQWPVKVS